MNTFGLNGTYCTASDTQNVSARQAEAFWVVHALGEVLMLVLNSLSPTVDKCINRSIEHSETGKITGETT